MKFAVVIPAYNRAHLIVPALESVAAQRRLPERVVVVDDGSTDNTAAVVDDWLAQRRPGFPLTLIRQANAGASAARNTGILAADDCDYIAFLDSDDMWPASHLAQAADFFAERPDAVAYAGQSMETFEDADGRVVSETLISLPVPPDIQGPAAFNRSIPHTSTSIIRRDVLLRCGLFDPAMRYAEDKLLFLKVYTKGYWGRPQAEPVYYRNKIKSIDSGQLSNRPHSKSRIRFGRRLEKEMARVRRESDTVYTDGIDEAVWRALHRTGREYDRLGQPVLARAYYRRALRYRPAAKTWLRFLGACTRTWFS